MKRLIVYSIIGLMLTACSDRELTTENIDNVPAESSFLSVSIVASGTTGTRAATELPNGDYENEGGYYRDGTNAENYVNEVLFLFFNDAGEPALAFKNETSGSYQTYFLWNVTEENNENTDEDHDTTVEKILNETIHISVPHNQAKPTQLFAVINPTAEHKTSLISKKLSELTDIVEDYEFDENNQNAKLSEKGTFVMTNSVYYKDTDSGKNIIYTTKIDKYYDTEKEADENPVYVFVERVLARIDLQININNSTANRKEGTDANGDKFYYYYTGTTLPDGETVDGTTYEKGEPIYVRFLGWNVFDTPNKSRLIKNIGDASWDNTGFFRNGLPWNSVDFHRSFWAINPAKERFAYRKGSLVPEANLDTETGNADKTFETWYANNNHVPAPDDEKDYVTAYFQENAAPLEANATSTDKVYGQAYIEGAPVTPSKVIIAAQLVDANGKPRELAKWAGKFYGSWDGLATQFCNGELDLYYVEKPASESDHSTVLHKIKPEHLAYKASNDSYKVTVVLSEEGEKVTWYRGENIDTESDFDESAALTAEQVNNYIKSITGENTVMVWKNGYTYFYFTIRHLGYDEKSPAYYGVVRNHIYDATVSKVSGLGTPVSDPNSTITVTPPDEDTGILAAQVRILSWRLVTQSYELDW